MYRWLFIFLISAQNLWSQPHARLTPEVLQSYNLVFSLRFQEAETFIAEGKKTDNQNLQYTYLENYIDYLSLFISEDIRTFETLSDNKSDRLSQVEKLPKSEPYRLYMIANINLQWALSRLKFGEYSTAGLEFIRAYRAIEENQQQFPDFLPNQITLGAIHAMIGVVPDKYQWMLKMINLSGSVAQGKQELSQALELTNNDTQYKVFRQEILFYHALINMNFYDKTTNLDTLNQLLAEENPDNLLLKYMTINLLMRTGKNDVALGAFSSIDSLNQYYPFYYLEYLKAECYLRRMDMPNASDSYQDFIQNFAGTNYLTDAHRKLAWCSLLAGDTTAYFAHLTEITTSETEVGIDKEAKREAQQKTVPNVSLIKSRLLFDGGYYDKAYSELIEMNLTKLTNEQKLEREYRLARIYDKTEQWQKAITAYRKTMAMGKTSKNYFAGNSALLLGNIFETKADTLSAIQAYEQCLDLDFEVYRNSIQTKARQQLKKLKSQN